MSGRLDGPFVSCEDALPPVLNLHNFYAALSSVPLMCVPLYSLWLALGLRVPPSARLPKALLLAFLLALTCLFGTNLHQHMIGGRLSFRLHEMMAALQALWNAAMLNSLSRRANLRWAVDERSGVTIAAAGTAAIVGAALGWPDLQEPMCGAVQALTAPLIIGTMGFFSRGDARAWWLFRRSCTGLVAVQLAVGVEPGACAALGSAAVAYHALVDHASIWCLFGGVSLNAVHLVGREVGEAGKRGE